MLNTTNSNSEYLHNYIRRVAKQEQESVDTSNVYTGTIEATQSGIYTVTLNQSDNSSSVLAIPIVTGDIYDKNDYVYLLKANTTATVNYFIVGKVNAVQETFFNLTDLERFNPNESKVDLSFGSNDFISISGDANNIFNSINELGYFQLEVKITSKVEDDAKIIIYLNYTDKSHYGAKFVFSSYEFIGQPGGNNYTLVQKKIFHLPSNIDIENIRIEKVGDFSVAAMNIVAGSLLEVSAAYQNNIIVQNDKNYFEKDIEIEDDYTLPNTVTLTSKVYYNNKPLVGDALQYHWFLKDDEAINDESDDYLDIEGAGNGWRCLNNFQWVNTAETKQKIDANGNLVFDESGNAVYEFVQIRLWDNKNNFIVLNKTNEFVNFSNFVNKVKCIVKYFDNFIESDLIDIYNYDYEQFSATLTTNVDPVIIIDRDDEIQLECKITNNNSKSNLSDFIYKYEWHLGDTVLSNLKDSLVKIQDKASTTLKEEDIQDNIREMENDIEEYYCKVSIYHKNDVIDGEVIEGKQPISEEISNTIQVTSAAAATDIQEEVQYKYYIADNHSITFEENTQASEDTELSKWSGDWDIYDSNVDSPSWSEGSFDKVFNDLNLFSNKDTAKEYFVYYTKRTIVRQGLKILRKENGSFPQIARSVINVNGWKNHRVGDNINQLNTFNQLTKNGEEDGIYYAEIPELVKDSSTPIWGTTYYKRIATDSNIEYEPITLKETISFKETETYYVSNEDGSYSMIDKSVGYDFNTDYYKKINDTEYQKLIVNTQNFDIEVDWPDGEEGPFYENIDNKLFINATYIRSGTLEVNNKFYASIDQDDVRIAGFNVNDTTLESKNGIIGLNSDNSDLNNIAIWAGTKNGDKHPFQVTHEGKLNATDANIEGTIRATELYIGNSQTSLIQANSNILGFNSNDFYINSRNLRLNYDKETKEHSVGYFEIDTAPLQLIHQNTDSYSLTIDTENLKYNTEETGENNLEITGKITATDLTISREVAQDAGLITSPNLLSNSHIEYVGTGTRPEFVRTEHDLAPIFETYGYGEGEDKPWYTLSFDLMTPLAGFVMVYGQNGSGAKYLFSKYIEVLENNINKYNRYKVTFKPTEGDILEQYAYLAFYGEYGTGRIPHVKNIKLEIGDTGLLIPEWSPAPSDTIAFQTEFAVDTTKNLISLRSKTLKLQSNDLIIDTSALKFNTDGENKLEITGTIHATEGGTIGGFHIASNHLADGDLNEDGSTDDHLVILSPGLTTTSGDNEQTYVFWAGKQTIKKDDSSRPFWITNNGFLFASLGNIGGWNIDKTSFSNLTKTIGLSSSGEAAFWAGNADTAQAPFLVTQSGNLKATSAIFDDNISIVAERGNVAGTIDSVGISSTAIRIYQEPSSNSDIVWMTEITPVGIISGTKLKTNIENANSEWLTTLGETQNVTVVIKSSTFGEDSKVTLKFINGLFTGTG